MSTKQTRALTWDYVCELEDRRTDALTTNAALRAVLRVALAALERNMGDEPSAADITAHTQITAALRKRVVK